MSDYDDEMPPPLLLPNDQHLPNNQPWLHEQPPQQLTALPHCCQGALLSKECANAEASDGIYLSNDYFRMFNGDDSDELVVIKITTVTNQRSTYAHIIGTHSEDRNAVFMPPWMFQILGIDCAEPILLEKYRDCKIGLNIRIQPHESFYATLPDPVAALRDAFESYTVIQAGTQISLLVADRQLSVSIIDTNSMGPICIRGMELEVTIDTPLDQQTNSIEEELPQELPQEEIDFSCMLPSLQRAKELALGKAKQSKAKLA